MTKVRAVFRRRWWLLTAGVVLGMVAGVASSMLAPEGDAITRYRVSQLIIANPSAGSVGGVEQDALRVTRGEVAAAAAASLGETDEDAIGTLVSARADPETNTIEVAAKSIDPDQATRRVTAFVDAFLDVVNGDVIRAQEETIAQYQGAVDEAKIALTDFDRSNPSASGAPLPGQVVDPSVTAERQRLQQAVSDAEQQLRAQRLGIERTLPYSTLGPDAPVDASSDLLPVPSGLPFRIGLLGIFGLMMAIGVVLVLERFLPRIDTRDELVSAVTLPVLAEVGYFPSRRLPRDPDGTLRLDGAWAEPYRRIRSAIQFVQADTNGGRPPKVFMFTSPSPSEGKSTTTAVTALALAEAGERTLVVGGDFRRPSVHRMLGVSTTPGVRERAQLDVDRPELAAIIHPTAHEHLFVAPSGVPGKEVVGLADAAKSLITAAVGEGATVLVDTSPVEVANDAIDLLPVVDHVILVVRSGRTSRRTLLHTIEQLQMHGADIIGTALIGTPGVAKQQYYYDGYYVDPRAGTGSTGGSASSAEPFRPVPT